MPKRLPVKVDIANETFTFQLDQRVLDLGQPDKATYYWMDNREFRTGRSDINLQACLDHFWAVMKLQGDLDDPDTQTALILAELFPYVKKKRSLQNIYTDALPRPSADRERLFNSDSEYSRLGARAYTLPEDDEARINELVSSQGIPGVKQELDALFLVHRPDPGDRDVIQQMFTKRIEPARDALLANGREALRTHLKTKLAPWIDTQRKGSGPPINRVFLNALAYECKVAFHTAYANAWISLLRHLKEKSLLDPMSERLMRLWHHQNQPSEAVDVQYPSDRWLFCGQVLALHPLSAVVFEDILFRLVLGAWLNDPDFSQLETGQDLSNSPTYQKFVAMILKAGHVYRHGREAGESKRKAAGGSAIQDQFAEYTDVEKYGNQIRAGAQRTSKRKTRDD